MSFIQYCAKSEKAEWSDGYSMDGFYWMCYHVHTTVKVYESQVEPW